MSEPMSGAPGAPGPQPSQQDPQPGPYGPQPGQPHGGYSGGYPGGYSGGYSGGQPPGQGYGTVRPPEMSPADQRLWGMLAHVSGLVSWLVGLPFAGPLVIYLVFRDRGVFVRRQAAEALNFQILVTVVFVACMAVGVLTLGLGFLVAGPVIFLGGAVALVLGIIAAVRANQGVDHRYPVNWRLVS